MGGSLLQIWWNVMLPMGKPALLTLGFLNTLYCWNDVLISLLVLHKESYALYPQMTVAENMTFSLRMAHSPKAEIAAKLAKAAAIFQLEPLLERKPAALSGGQRQRVAIGRANVRDPQVFLFDEPLSNLDAELRVQPRVEIAKLHQALGNTIIYVTHDQIEAMTLADQIVVLRAGRIEQVGAPMDL